MVTGISRFTKGAFSQSALDDVYNKGRELYKDPESPPSSGLQPNSTDLIWADMHDAPTGYPVSTSSGYDQFKGPVFKGTLPLGIEGWGSVNAWFEIEEATCDNCSCGFNISEPTNTQVELSPMYAWALTNDGTWHQYSGSANAFGGTTSPSEGTLFKGNRGCNVNEIENIRQANAGYDTKTGARTFLPKFYFREHGWANNARYQVDKTTIKAVFLTYFARLVKINTNGTDDFQAANFVAHQASDIKASDGTQVPGYEGAGIGGISRFKTIPKNGDWMPCNFLEGFITKEELEANPPPFPTTP